MLWPGSQLPFHTKPNTFMIHRKYKCFINVYILWQSNAISYSANIIHFIKTIINKEINFALILSSLVQKDSLTLNICSALAWYWILSASTATLFVKVSYFTWSQTGNFWHLEWRSTVQESWNGRNNNCFLLLHSCSCQSSKWSPSNNLVDILTIFRQGLKPSWDSNL